MRIAEITNKPPTPEQTRISNLKQQLKTANLQNKQTKLNQQQAKLNQQRLKSS
ncbi:hypothetical protein [Polynucleobacter sphagniphilus]|jgi:hypothetical protein|uniref:hypothetical protein n=1 Tax=Polynucleobacter sphagniphilus TaxID=1743169 RepID=UPI002476BC35|nr:hypothetical protein [Polynucleobacter sphagniphilus]MDH6153842.1 hypothetical protein [Polynucleobacter sphagniphilus]MDH6421120.1 hypothetical protein [Polynucleobacter sphagniphilus]MDH6524993.1 hypothetical protein [Polynucleobacter sphagniphilus]